MAMSAGIAGWKRGAFLLRLLGKPGVQQTERGESKLPTTPSPENIWQTGEFTPYHTSTM